MLLQSSLKSDDFCVSVWCCQGFVKHADSRKDFVEKYGLFHFHFLTRAQGLSCYSFVQYWFSTDNDNHFLSFHQQMPSYTKTPACMFKSQHYFVALHIPEKIPDFLSKRVTSTLPFKLFIKKVAGVGGAVDNIAWPSFIHLSLQREAGGSWNEKWALASVRPWIK